MKKINKFLTKAFTTHKPKIGDITGVADFLLVWWQRGGTINAFLAFVVDVVRKPPKIQKYKK